VKADYRHLGALLKELREERDIGRKQLAADLGCDEKSVRRWEAGGRFADRERLIRFFKDGLKIKAIDIINRGLKLAGFVAVSSEETTSHGLIPAQQTHNINKMFLHEPQQTEWGPNKGEPPGIICYQDNARIDFIPWATLKNEVEKRLLNQLGPHIPTNCKVILDDYRGRANWLVRIIDAHEQRLGYVWFGTDADNDWRWDGLVRTGDDTYVVWQVFHRYSDGSYARIRKQKPRSGV
jgi:transcriptional regulator with XRE-family HTH domain